MLTDRFSTLQDLEAATAALERLTETVSGDKAGQLRHLLGDLLLLCNTDIQRARNDDSLVRLQLQEKDVSRILSELSHSVLEQPMLEQEQRIQKRIESLQEKISACSETSENVSPKPEPTTLREVKLLKYGYDESEKFFKLYLDIPGLCPDDTDRVTCRFRATSFRLEVREESSRTLHTLHVERLTGTVTPAACKYRLKPGQIRVMLAKADPSVKWIRISAPETCPDNPDQDKLQERRVKLYILEVGYTMILITSQLNPTANLFAIVAALCAGLYIIDDEKSARRALELFVAFPPIVVSIELSEELRNSAVWPSLRTAVANYPCEVVLTCKDSFLNPRYPASDSALLSCFFNSRCAVLSVYGYFDTQFIQSLPVGIFHVGLAINSAEDAESVGNESLYGIISLGISVRKGLSPADLRALPFSSQPIQFLVTFAAVADQDIEWVFNCLKTLLQSRKCALVLACSQLSYTGVLALYALCRTSDVVSVTVESSGVGESQKPYLCSMFKTTKCRLNWKWAPTIFSCPIERLVGVYNFG